MNAGRTPERDARPLGTWWSVLWLTSLCAVVSAFNPCKLAAADANELTPLGTHEGEAVFFERDVRPILKAMCFHCHGEGGEREGGLDVRLVRLIQAGGDSGTALVPGDLEASLLWQRVESDEMPASAKKLTAKQKEVLRKWIELGGRTARPEPENVEDAEYTPEELDHWAFQPVRRVAPPQTESGEALGPIDAFVAAELRKAGLGFSPMAERGVLLRRVSLDLTGLPPTPEELDSFLSDAAPDAYERVVDRLLASPQFGVRWGRYWLDVAGYAETEGNTGEDVQRPEAWRYRDYVIQAFNNDKGYDAFIQEQLAGDELIDGVTDPENDRHVELLTATGFLRMAPNLTGKSDLLVDRNQAVSDTLKVVSSSVLGLTVGCAQCHDHRYDPISAKDYYRFRAVFDPAFPLDTWTPPDKLFVDMTPQKDREAADVIEAQAASREETLEKRRLEVAQSIHDGLLAKLSDEVRPQVQAAIAVAEEARTDEQKKLLESHPMVKSVDFIKGFLLEYDKTHYREFEAEQKAIADLRTTKPAARRLFCVQEHKASLPSSAVFFRGDPLQKKQPVEPGEIFVLARHRQVPAIPVNVNDRPTTGRRLAYARQLTQAEHPLTARVAVNRVWMHLFGKGLVNTPSDFGLFGERPTHPDLLDWLANRFVEDGWHFKSLIRQLVTSRVYRQVTIPNEAGKAADPDNRLLWRMNLRRMDAESIRDSILSVSGLLNLQMAGPSVPVAEDIDGKTVVGKLKLADGLFENIEDVGDQKYRRSIYIQVQRATPLNMLDTFDLPAMSPNCDRRKSSTVAPQSLWFLNDELIVGVTDLAADQFFANLPGGPEQRVSELYRRYFTAQPTPEEMQMCLDYLTVQAERFRADPEQEWQATLKEHPHAADVRAFASLSQALLSTNRFLYIE